ncbi:bifunctional methionine sulfoxide reductase B/A protein [Mailhella sp.]|uniref:bifunctional methionine sulfoxide reductase B/A protein n=1 Tax=Mailhella sp. TaxID=1981029 RepID=UPI003AB332E7
MNGRNGARRVLFFLASAFALACSVTGAADAAFSRPTFDPLREVPPMIESGFRIVARGDAAVPPLTPMEAEVILRKATEAPWTGKYEKNEAAGTYLCRQCGVALYRSADKFNSGCGWPAFDDALPGMVRRLPDADGFRVEIQCNHCGAHLGHVFEGERLTEKNTRYCVNSVSMSFAPAGSEREKLGLALYEKARGTSVAVLAGGCFWGVEDAMSKLPGVVDVRSGYTGGHTDRPSYEDVCRGNTGHAEAVLVRFQPEKISYEAIVRRFFEIHDPTQLNRQGPDVGSQYRSAVFWLDESQKATAQKLMEELRSLGYNVVTRLEPAGPFYEAEAWHQDFVRRTGRGGCHLPVPRFDRRADGSPR